MSEECDRELTSCTIAVVKVITGKSYLYAQNKNNATNRQGGEQSETDKCDNRTNTIGNYIHTNTHSAAKRIQTE
jgi:hypothetical protein